MVTAAVLILMSIPSDSQRWGEETLDQIRRDFYLPNQHLYTEDETKKQPAFNWSCGVLLSALNAGARANKKYEPWLRDYAEAMRRYWHKDGGFDVLPLPKPKDRYYDDNAWMALALMETFEVLHEKKYLDWAERTVDFILTGGDEKLGGGIYWRENEKKSKNTCSNAPTALACARLAVLTHKGKYLAEARRLYDWTKRTLEDPATHLYWDNIDLAGKIDKTNWSYNTALMIRAGAALFKLTNNTAFERDAAVSNSAAGRRWMDQETGLIKDGMAFAHLLFEASHEMGNARGGKFLKALHDKARDANGRYGHSWNDLPSGPRKHYRLIDQASAARAYLLMSGRAID